MRPCLQVVILLQDGDAGSDCGDNDDDGGDDDDGGGDGGGGDDDDDGGGDGGGGDDGGSGDDPSSEQLVENLGCGGHVGAHSTLLACIQVQSHPSLWE